MSDLDIIKELEKEIGQKIPVVGLDETIPENANGIGAKVKYEILHATSGFGLFIDSGNQVLGASFFNFDLKSIPQSVFKFKCLKKLSLRSNELESLSNRISSLMGLEVLIIDDNKLTSLPPEITQLTNLSKLNLTSNQLTSLPPEITQLTNLSELNLNSNGLTSLPPEITQLTNLSELFLDNNQLASLPSEIGQLTNLTRLDADNNQLTSLPPAIGELTNLSELYLQNNQLTSLPPEIAQLTNLSELFLSENPLVTPPSEVAEQGIEAIRDYFEQIEKEKGQTQYLFESKLLIIGDGGTGKTTFKLKIVDPDSELPAEDETTRGIDVDTWSFRTEYTIEGEATDVEFNVNLWDFGGQDLYRGTHQMFFSEKSYYVLVADTRKQATDYSYWLNTVLQLAGKESCVLILLNTKFGHEIRFDKTGYQSHFGDILEDVVSLDLGKEKSKVRDLQKKVMLHLKELPGIGDPLPPSWVQIRGDIKGEKEKAKFISFDDFREICKKYEITSPSVIKTLSVYYTRIGVFLHYIDDKLLKDRIYLDSNWLLETVYEILDNEKIREKAGRLTAADVTAIWGENELDFEIDRLAQLMHKFGLMYEVRGQNAYVVPEHLPEVKPYQDWPHTGTVLHFTYEFDKYMPYGLMSRLIVALHTHINDHDLVWHRGVNLEREGAHAEIIESYGGSNSFEIRIAGSNKIELLAVIRERFEEVLSPFKNLNYEQKVSCSCGKCEQVVSPDKPGFHSYKSLLQQREAGKQAYCPKFFELVDVNRILRVTEPRGKGGKQSVIGKQQTYTYTMPPVPAEKPWYKKPSIYITVVGVCASLFIAYAAWRNLPEGDPLKPAMAQDSVANEVVVDESSMPEGAAAMADSSIVSPDSLSTPPDSTASDTTVTSP